MIVAHPHASATLAHMKPCWNAQSAISIDIKLMGQHRRTFSTYQLLPASVQWSQIPPMQERCNTELATNPTQQKWQISLMALITPYFGSRLSQLVAKSFQIGSSLTLVILHLACPLMALVLSSTILKLHGQSFYSITISLLKGDFWRGILLFQLA